MTEPLYFTHLINSCGPDGLKYSITGEDDPVKGEDFVIFLYSILTESLGELDIFVKAYAQDRLHGDNPLELIGTVSSINLISDLSTFTQTATAEFNEPCISSISGTFKTKEGLKLVVPMMDLDIPSSGQSKEKIYHDLIPLISILMKNKVSGYILRSGDVGRGSYHFVCDFVVPYNPSFWQSIGWFMEIMVEEQFQNRNVVDSKRLGMSLSKAQTLEEARVIANEILNVFPSIPDGLTREGLFSDPRWGAHKILQGINTLLRVSPAKDYQNPPKFVADVRSHFIFENNS